MKLSKQEIELQEKEINHFNFTALVELREQLSNVLSPKTDFSTELLETVDVALTKLINETIIKTK